MEPARNLLIIHQGAIGDFILSLPAIGAFRHHHPGAGITIWGHQQILRLVHKRYYADSTASIEHQRLSSLYSGQETPPRYLAKRLTAFDRIVVFGGDQQMPLLHGLRKMGVREVKRIIPFPPDNGNLHVIDFQAAQLAARGITVPESIPKLFPNGEDECRASSLFEQKHGNHEMRTVALHPGSGSTKKAWPLESFVSLAGQLLADNRVRIVLLTGPAEAEAAENHWDTLAGDSIIPLRCRPLNEVAAILKHCDLYLGNDSGISHLAAAVGIPAVVLFGPTNPLVWAPRGNRVSIVYRETSCSPCTRDEMHRCREQLCLKEISLDVVLRVVYDRLQFSGKDTA